MALGDFGLVKGTDWEGKLIRFGEWVNGDGKSIYSHAFIQTSNDGFGETEIVEAMSNGACLGTREAYGDRVIMSSWQLTPVQRDAIVTTAKALLGTPYSFLDYLSLAAVRFHIRPHWLQRYVADTGHMICSQLVDEAYWAAGLHMFEDGRFSGDVTPQDLAHVLGGPKVNG